MYEVERIAVEIASTIACFILVRFMIKPFRLTGETRYLGLPLGFGFLGASYAFSALSFSPIFDFVNKGWVQLFVRAFAFLFLAITYYFSKSTKTPKLLWNTTLLVLVAILTVLILFAVASPQFERADYQLAQVFVRISNLICVAYIVFHTLESHVKHSDPTTILVPFGYIFLGIGQYSVLIWAVDSSILAFFAGLASRMIGLAVFLIVSYRAFYGSEKGR